MTGLADLDELTLRCRNERAREHIGEAVACYKAGAFRSCIVSTWNAVVFDYLHKLRELEMSGDNNAKKHLIGFDEIRLGGESRLKDALDFERELLNVAEKEFELFGPLEREDLGRLQKDRSRCAHPSMQSAEEPYQPTAELARTHLRSAVEIMLSREPVQGQAALKLILSDIDSLFFPKEIEAAVAHFRAGPFRRARRPLVRNLTIVLLKSILNTAKDVDELLRFAIALAAVNILYREDSENTIKLEFSRLAQNVNDANLWRLLAVCRYVPFAWESFDVSMRSKLSRYVENVAVEKLAGALWHAAHIPALKDIVQSRVAALTEKQLKWLIRVDPLPEYVSHAIGMFARAGNFRGAEHLADTLILPLAAVLKKEELAKILAATAENGQIWNAGRIPEKLARLFESTAKLLPETILDWQRASLQVQARLGDCDFPRIYAPLIQVMEAANVWPPPPERISDLEFIWGVTPPMASDDMQSDVMKGAVDV